MDCDRELKELGEKLAEVVSQINRAIDKVKSNGDEPIIIAGAKAFEIVSAIDFGCDVVSDHFCPDLDIYVMDLNDWEQAKEMNKEFWLEENNEA